MAMLPSSIMASIPKYLLLITLWLAPAAIAWAEAQQQVEITAGTMTYDPTTQHQRFSDGVTITQDTFSISADAVDVYFEDELITQIVAIGEPARFLQRSAANTSVEGTADQLTYWPQQQALTLQGNVTLTQPDRTLSGERIDYNIKTRATKATASGARDPIRVLLQPKQETSR